MINEPKISAVITTFNRGISIRRAIESILAQEFMPAEIVVIDDGSTDGTAEIVAEFAERIRYVHQSNSGISAARNRGVAEAACEWVAFLDSDDIWLPCHLSKIREAMTKTDGAAAIYFSDLEKNVDGRSVRHWQRCGLELKGDYELRQDASEWVFMHVQPFMVQSSVFRRAAYLESRGLPESMRVREDTLLFYKLALCYPACAVSGCGMVQKDDVPVRLTKQLNEFTTKYCMDTITMYREVLAMGKALRPDLRKRVVEELSAAYYSAARAFFRQNRFLHMAWHLWLSSVTSAGVYLECLAVSMARFKSRRRPEPTPAPLLRQ